MSEARGDVPAWRTYAPAALALVFAALYALPLYAPPSSTGLVPPAPDASLLARLLPGVPWWWSALRLLALASGAGCAAVWLRTAAPETDERAALQPSGGAACRRSVAPAFARCAMATAALHVAVSPLAGRLGRGAELLYLAALAVPALILWIGERTAARREGRGANLRRPPVPAGTWALVVMWSALRVALATDSSRAANVVDGADGYACLLRLKDPGFHGLVDGCYAGLTALPSLVQGGGLLSAELVPLSPHAVQWAEILWTAVAALLIAKVSARMFPSIGATAANVAAAVFLFSPLQIVNAYWTSPSVVLPALVALMLAIVLRYRRCGSPAALAALGATAGVAFAFVPLLPTVALVGAWAARDWTAWRRSPPPARSHGASEEMIAATAVASFAAAVLPALARMAALGSMVSSYGGADGSWAAMEAALFGQISGVRAEGAVRAFDAGRLDVPLGLLLSPFATPRTALRLWGDTVIEPLGAALAAVGLALAIPRLRRSPTARLLLLSLAATLLPGVVSSYDRPSLLRVAAMATPIALLAAYAATAIERRLCGLRWAGRTLSLGLPAVIAIGGVWLFDVVNPRILPAAAASMARDIAAHGAPDGVVALDGIAWDVDYARWHLQQASAAPIVVWDRRTLAARAASTREPPLVLLYAPGQEEDAAIASLVCRAWPQTTTYILTDSSATTVLLAAVPRPERWQPPASARVREVIDCHRPVPTETRAATVARGRADDLLAAGDAAGAVATLERASCASFAQPPLFLQTARVLAAHPGGDGDALERAATWATRACRVRRQRDPQACAEMADRLAAIGRYRQAADAAKIAGEAALARGDAALAARLQSDSVRYSQAAKASAIAR